MARWRGPGISAAASIRRRRSRRCGRSWRLIAVALLDLPQPVILPGLDVVGVGFQRALVPDLAELVVAELAVGVADQIGHGGTVVVTKRLQLPDRGRIVVPVIDRGVGRAV